MNSGEIFAALAVSFIVFITVRGELPAYMGLFIPASGNAPGGGNTASNPFDMGAQILGSALKGGLGVPSPSGGSFY